MHLNVDDSRAVDVEATKEARVCAEQGAAILARVAHDSGAPPATWFSTPDASEHDIEGVVEGRFEEALEAALERRDVEMLTPLIQHAHTWAPKRFPARECVMQGYGVGSWTTTLGTMMQEACRRDDVARAGVLKRALGVPGLVSMAFSPGQVAAGAGSLQVLQLLTEPPAAVRMTPELLATACGAGQEAVVRWLLEPEQLARMQEATGESLDTVVNWRGKGPRSVMLSKGTPLCRACERGRIGVVRFLLDPETLSRLPIEPREERWHAHRRHSETLIDVSWRHPEVLTYLGEHFGRLQLSRARGKPSPVVRAAAAGHYDSFCTLIRINARVGRDVVRVRNGGAVVRELCRPGYPFPDCVNQMILMLLKLDSVRGAVNRLSGGETLLHTMCASESPYALETLDALLAVPGIDVNARNSLGRTPLYALVSGALPVRCPEQSLVRLHRLLCHGASLDASTGRSESLAECAVREQRRVPCPARAFVVAVTNFADRMWRPRFHMQYPAGIRRRVMLVFLLWKRGCKELQCPVTEWTVVAQTWGRLPIELVDWIVTFVARLVPPCVAVDPRDWV